METITIPINNNIKTCRSRELDLGPMANVIKSKIEKLLYDSFVDFIEFSPLDLVVEKRSDSRGIRIYSRDTNQNQIIEYKIKL